MNCICTLYDKNFESFIKYPIQTFNRFANIYGYDTIYFDKVFDPSLHPSWNKLYAILDCFNRGYQRVLWTDADSLFIGKKIEFSNDDFITSSDSNGLCLSHMLVRNTVYNIKLLQTLLFLQNVKDDSIFGKGLKWEQNTLKALLLNFNIPYTTFPRGFVKEPKYDACLDNSHFLHFAVTSIEERNISIPKYYKLYE